MEGLIGKVIDNKYRIKSLLNHGNQGHVFVIEDIRYENPKVPLVMKISSDTASIENEIKLLKKVNRKN